MKRVYWSQAEKKEVAEVSFTFRNDHAFTGSDLDCVREAMRKCLRPDRHRNLISMAAVKEHKRPLIQGAVHPHVEREHAPQFSLTDVSIADLFKELSKRIDDLANPNKLRALIRAEVNATIDRRLPGVIPPDTLDVADKPKPRAVVPKVAVIGLLGQQQHMLKQHYNGQVDFHWLEGNEGSQRVKNTARTMDLTIKSKWSKGELGSTKDFEKFHAVNGGLGQIRALINRTFMLDGAPAAK
jgi:hypothetical protein